MVRAASKKHWPPATTGTMMDSIEMPAPPAKIKPMAWLFGLGILCIILGVIAGLIGIAIVAKRKQRYRIVEPPTQPVSFLRESKCTQEL